MELGIISLSDLTADRETGRPVAALDRLDETLANARAAHEHGLDVFTLGEHHSHKFAVASPAVVRAAIAGQSERIPLTGGVTALSALDPVRVYLPGTNRVTPRHLSRALATKHGGTRPRCGRTGAGA